MLHYLRAFLRPFAIKAAYNPIETVVFFSVVGTLAYFHILNAIKHSSFFAPPLVPPLRPAHVVKFHGEWVSVRESVWHHAAKDVDLVPVEAQQVIFTLDSKHPDSLSLTHPVLASSILNATNHLSNDFAASSRLTYPSTCFRTSEDDCFTHQQASPHSFIHTLAFSPGARDDYVSALLHKPPVADHSGTSFALLPNGPAPPEPNIGKMKSLKWIAYAARALVVRFYTLALKADSLDILLILVGYVLMHTTFYLLITRSRALGSNFWLPCAIMSSSVLALLLSLPIAMALRIPIDPVALTEALPFLVCTVGFDKPLRLARAVFLHPHLTTPPVALSSLPQSSLSPSHPNYHALPLKPGAKILTESLSLTYHPIIRDYILEIAVLVVGANSKVVGLREVCALAALLLAVDCLLMITYLVAVLGVMIEVHRIRAVRAMTKASLTRSRSSSISSLPSAPNSPTLSSKPIVPSSGRPSAMAQALAPPSFSERLLGIKGSSLIPVPGSKASMKDKKRDDAGGDNPVARLKLLLIASFTTLHILNLITPLAPNYQHGSGEKGNLSMTNGVKQVQTEGGSVRRVDITEQGVRGALDAFAFAVGSKSSVDDESSDDSSEEKTQLLVKLSPPIWVRVVPSPELIASSTSSTPVSPSQPTTPLERFMSSWTRLVGDPVISKWIVVVLAISISLNGYLLKGIAAGLGLGLGLVRKEGDGVRFSDSEGEESRYGQVEVEKVEKKKKVAMPTFTLDDVDRKLQADGVVVRKRRGTVGAAGSPVRPVYLPTPPSRHVPTPLAISPPQNAIASSSSSEHDGEGDSEVAPPRPLKELIEIYEDGPKPASLALEMLTDEEVILLAQNGKIAAYSLEKVFGNERLERAVRVRRALVSRASKTQTLEYADIPMRHYDYSRVMGACCENVVGYIPLPLGIAGPLNVDGELYPIPMATAEGTLVASTSRGCKALNAGGGVTTVLTKDGMTRGPAIDFPSIVMAADAKAWIASEEGYGIIKAAFESTSRFAKLRELKTALAGRTLFVRFATATGDAMGMNMISKGTERALEVMRQRYPEMDVLALSGNYCTDKKPAAINWIEGRGKSVVAEAVIPGSVVKSVLKTSVSALCNLNIKKNLIGSAMAGSVGGFNAHAANILTAVFLATGQDPAQNVESSNCMTLMEPTNDGEDLLMTITMPCIEVGTVGGGTVLGPQQGVLEMLGIKGAHPTHPGQNAQRLARIIAAAVMAGELSLLSALAAGHLVRAHLVHNRSQVNTPATTPGGSTYSASGSGATGGMLVQAESKEVVALRAGLTPSSSTASLPPYVR